MNKALSSIAVVGAGAIGCYFGGMLARAGVALTLIGRKRHVDAINQQGLLLETLDFEQRIPIAASDNMTAISGAPLVLFCVKSNDTEDAARAMAPHLAPDAVILSLQNGVDNAERIRQHVRNLVLPALVYAAANMPGPGHVKHTGGGSLIIGQSSEDRADKGPRQGLLRDIVALFAGAGVPVTLSDSIESELWTKLLMNCAYNAISALGAATYSQMVAMPEVRDVMRAVVDELQRVAQTNGVHLPDDILEATMALANAMPHTRSSTAQDIAACRRTEIDHLNGFVVRQAAALGIPTPVNQTLYALIKLLERTKPGTTE